MEKNKNQNKKLVTNRQIFQILLGAVFCFGFLLAVTKAEAAFNCSLGGSYADSATCSANCLQTASCSLNPISVSGGGGANINFWLTASGNRIDFHTYGESGGPVSGGAVTLNGFTASGGTLPGAQFGISASGNQICQQSNNGEGWFSAGCVTLNGATASGGAGGLNTNVVITASGNRICFSGDNGEGRFDAGCITLTPTNYSCPLSGGSACNASHQCTRPGTCTYVAPAPTVNLAANPTLIIRGNSSTLSWSSTNATRCTASGGWIGDKPTSGTAPVSPTANTTYTLTCTGPGGSAQDSAAVTVNAAAPTVSLNANPTSIFRGSSSTLSWSSTNATQCSASANPGSSAWTGTKSTSGSQSVSPTSTTLYTIACTGPGGSASSSASVTVNTPAPTLTISADPTPIYLGNTTTIRWSTTDATRCTASVDWSGDKSVNGSQVVTPTKLGTSNNYVLTCTGPGGSVVKSPLLTVNQIPAPTLTLSANPPTITSGNSSRLTWTVGGNATSCTASNNKGLATWNGAKAFANGTYDQSVSPTTSTQFSLRCSNAGGSVTRDVTVNVDVVPPTVTFTADPKTITQGGSSVLTWTVLNATGCDGETLDGVTDPNWPAGSRSFSITPRTQTVFPPRMPTTTYKLNCWNAGGGVDAYQTINVDAPLAPAVNLDANPISISGGEPTALTWTTANVSSCAASNDTGLSAWNGTKGLAGTQNVTPAESTNFRLSCTGPNGSAADSASVSVSCVDSSYSGYACMADDDPCADSNNCGKPYTLKKTCYALSNCGRTVSRPETDPECAKLSCESKSGTCPACSGGGGDWIEVAP